MRVPVVPANKGEAWVIYRHDVAWSRTDSAWYVQYPNGWSRRSIMNFQGQVLYTRWIRPKEE